MLPSDVTDLYHGPMIRRRSRPQAKNIHLLGAKNIHLQLRNLIGPIESAMIQREITHRPRMWSHPKAGYSKVVVSLAFTPKSRGKESGDLHTVEPLNADTFGTND